MTAPPIVPSELRIDPLERAETIPSAWYTDPSFHQWDLRTVFAKTWQHVGHESRVSGAGDQLIAQVAGNPIILVRGQDLQLRSFYNVCRHRGGPLATEDCNTKVLQCKYHGWTYLLDGSLRGTPRFDRTELFDKKDYGLVPVRSGLWERMAFVHLSEDGEPLEKVFRGIRERIGPPGLGAMHFYKRVTYEVQCNWKVYVDNYLEGYHLPYVHPELCTLLDYQQYVTETFEFSSLQQSPLQKNDSPYQGDGPAFYFFVWPNFMLNILPGRLQTNTVVPLSSKSCQVRFDYYYSNLDSPKDLDAAEDDIRYSDRIQQEDIEICEHVQRGLESQAYDKGRFSPECENGVYHFQCLLKKAYERAMNGSR